MYKNEPRASEGLRLINQSSGNLEREVAVSQRKIKQRSMEVYEGQ